MSTYLYVAFYSMVIIMSRTSFRVNTESIVCLNVTELLARSRRHIWTLRYSNDIQTHNHLVCKRTVNRLTQLAKWLSCVVSTYMYGAFGCMLLSRDVRKLEWIHTLWFSWMSKKLLVRSSRHIRNLSESDQIGTYNHLVGKRTLNHLAKLAK